jgi:hypothetical protein
MRVLIFAVVSGALEMASCGRSPGGGVAFSLRDSRRIPSCGIKADRTTAVLSTPAGALRIWETRRS